MESEVSSWLKHVLSQNLDDFSLEIVGSSEKGDGYMGDIVFVSLKPKNSGKSPYDLVLKCSKRSQALREKIPVKDNFLNEIFVYDKVFPALTQFQLEKGVHDAFDSVPKFYGAVTTDSMEVIVLENMKKIGYSLWDKKKPFTRKHINLVMQEYAKFHSISIAMKEQQPERFEELASHLLDLFGKWDEITDVEALFGPNIDELADLLQGDLEENILDTWKSFKKITKSIVSNSSEGAKIKVITHGDCWGNNFMFKNDPNNIPIKATFLDWQVSRYVSPIIDISYFLFAGISKEDIDDLDTILDEYYENLRLNAERLGTQLGTLYSKQEFLEDWNKYCKFGILMSSLVFKVVVTDKSEVIDIAQVAEDGRVFEDAFGYEVKDKDAFRERGRHIVKYVVEKGLL